MKSCAFRWMWVATLGWTLSCWPAGAPGQQGPPSGLPMTEPPRPSAPAGEAPAASAEPAGAGGDSHSAAPQVVGNRHLGKLSLKPTYDFDNGGYSLATEDDEYSFGVRGMTQLDARVYGPRGQGFAESGFYNPRSRFYLEGHLTKPIEYEFSFQNTFDSLGLLDAYANFNYDPHFQVRVGRYKTPFTYEWYHVHVWDLPAPERSLFATNFEGQRRFGLMGWGVLLDQRLEYAVGTFNSQRNSLQPFNDRQDVMAYLNFKPFHTRDCSVLRDLQIGGSVDAGDEEQSTLPAALRTNSAPSGVAVTSTAAGNAATLPFLAFNPAVVERGGRTLWELHLAYYHGGLSLLGAWQSGHESYAAGAAGAPIRIPINGWFLQAGYIVTGETIHDRTLLDPLRPFDLRRGHFGPGAWEVTARYSELNLDSRVFTAGLADPALWTNQAKLIDAGVNWYLNKFVKVYFDWEHATFGSPVFLSPGRFQTSNDVFWVRTQVYF